MSKLSLIIFGLVILVSLTTATREQEVLALREIRDAIKEGISDVTGRRTRNEEEGKQTKKTRNNKGNKNKSASQITDTCLEQVAIIMKKWKGIVTNFGKQMNRMKSQNKTGGNKAGKKGAFGPIALRIMEAGGGNKSSLSCGGSTDNDGAKQLKNLTDTLFACEDMIHDACDPANIPQPNMTKLDMCSMTVDKFKSGAEECLAKSTGASKTDTTTACSCWTDDALTEAVRAVSDCNFNTEALAVAAALKNCTKAFSTCRKFEDDAITSIMSCNTDATQLTQKASNLNTNAAAVKAANEKITNITGSSPRSANWAFEVATTCFEIIKYADKLAVVASNSPASPKVTTYAGTITGAGSITCSASEKASLKSIQTSLSSAADRIDSALMTVQEQIMTLTGSTASLVSITTKATRRRNFKF